MGESTDDSSTDTNEGNSEESIDPPEKDVGGQFIFTDVNDKVRIARDRLRNDRKSVRFT